MKKDSTKFLHFAFCILHWGKRPAFTLIEVVVAVGLFALLAVAGDLLLIGTLRGSKKAQAVALVRGEGGYALGVITDLIRYSRRVTACAGDGTSISVEDLVGTTSTFACISGGDVYLASNSARLTSNQVAVNSCNGVFTCDAPPPQTAEVAIKFSLHRAGALLPIESTADIDFSSQVSLRNQ